MMTTSPALLAVLVTVVIAVCPLAVALKDRMFEPTKEPAGRFETWCPRTEDHLAIGRGVERDPSRCGRARAQHGPGPGSHALVSYAVRFAAPRVNVPIAYLFHGRRTT